MNARELIEPCETVLNELIKPCNVNLSMSLSIEIHNGNYIDIHDCESDLEWDNIASYKCELFQLPSIQ